MGNEGTDTDTDTEHADRDTAVELEIQIHIWLPVGLYNKTKATRNTTTI